MNIATQIEYNIHELIKIAHILYSKHYVYGSVGNLSAKIGSNMILIKRSGAVLGKLKPRDLLLVYVNSKKPDNVSIDYPIHKKIYQLDSRINYIIHAHPKYLVLATILYDSIPLSTLDEKIMFKEEIHFIHVDEHSELEKLISKHDIERGYVIEKGHGIYTMGTRLEEAFNILEGLERVAEIYIRSARL